MSAATEVKSGAQYTFRTRNDAKSVTETKSHAGDQFRTRNALRRLGYAALHPKSTVCEKCERALRNDEPVYWEYLWRERIGLFGRFTRRWWAYVCSECRGDRAPHRPLWPGDVPDRDVGRACRQCGRLCYRRSRHWQTRPRQHVFCSDVCAGVHYRAPKLKAAAEARRKACATCGTSFEAGRRDATTCSPACRQKAYRKRHAQSAAEMP